MCRVLNVLVPSARLCVVCMYMRVCWCVFPLQNNVYNLWAAASKFCRWSANQSQLPEQTFKDPKKLQVRRNNSIFPSQGDVASFFLWLTRFVFSFLGPSR